MEKEKSFFGEPFFDEQVRKTLEEISGALKPNGKTKEEPEKTKQEIIQQSTYVGYFCPLVKTGERVHKGQKIGLIIISHLDKIGLIIISHLDKEEEIKAEADGIIKEILPEVKTGFTAKEIKEQYETTDAQGNKRQKERTFTSVEYGQALFILETEKSQK